MYYFIVNPVSRSGKGMEVWEQTKKILTDQSISYKVYFTQHVVMEPLWPKDYILKSNRKHW